MRAATLALFNHFIGSKVVQGVLDACLVTCLLIPCGVIVGLINARTGIMNGTFYLLVGFVVRFELLSVGYEPNRIFSRFLRRAQKF